MRILGTHLLWVIYFCIPTNLYAQDYQTISGTITDSNTGEHLIGVNIYTTDYKYGCTSNNYGYYSLKLPKNMHTVFFSHVGYKNYELRVNTSESKILNLKMESLGENIEEVTITENKLEKNITNPVSGYHKLKMKQVQNLPSIGGVNDILKTIQLLPGIQTGNDGTTNINVRGGAYDQNLFLLDEAPVYNPSHALSIYSTFNPNIIKDVSIYKGDFPSQYGGRVSSVVDIRTMEGNKRKFGTKLDLGLIASGLLIDGPIKKDTGSFVIAGRYCYGGGVVNGIDKLIGLIAGSSMFEYNQDFNMYFYDINAKANYKLNSKNHIFISAYNGYDNFFMSEIDDLAAMDWGNTIATFRWNRIASESVFTNLSLIYSHYKYGNEVSDLMRSRWESGLDEIDLKYDIDYYLNDKNKIKTGIIAQYHVVNPGSIEPMDSLSSTVPFQMNKKRFADAYLYLNHDIEINDAFKISYGARFSNFLLFGPGKEYSYTEDMMLVTDTINYSSYDIAKYYAAIEPRLALRYLVNKSTSLKLSVVRNTQYMHLLGNSTVAMPTDIWWPSDKYIKPVNANQFALSFNKQFEKAGIGLSMEAYYKTLENVIDYKDNADLYLSNHLETEILSGSAEAYGMEFLLERPTGKLNGWISYTYSRVQNTINGINNGKPYSPRYDKPHNLSVVLNWQITKRTSINSIFKYNSGGYITVPSGSFYYDGLIYLTYTERNSYELPSYHRLDLSMTIKSKPHKRWDREWSFGLYNIYNRKNAFSIYLDQSGYLLQPMKMYLSFITPFINYSINF